MNMGFSSAFPLPKITNLEQGQYENEEKINIGHRRGISIAEIAKSLIEDIDDRGDGGVHRPTPGESENLVKKVETTHG